MADARARRSALFLLLDILLPAALGGVATLGFAPFGIYGLTLLAVAGLIALWWRASAARAAWRGFVFGVVHFGTGIYWVFVSTHVYAGAPLWMGVLLVFGLSMYMALYPAAVGAFAGATKRLPRPLWVLVFVPGAWMLGELMRSWVVTGFPWLSLGYSLIDAPVTALAPIGGVYMLSALLVAAAGTVVLLLAGSLIGRAISVVLIAVAPVVLWSLPAATSWTRPVGEPGSVAILQGNFRQDIKWDRDYLKPTMRRYWRLTAQTDAELVVWPEVAIPARASRVPRYLDALETAARAKDQTVLVGIRAGAPTLRAVGYNAVLAVGEGEGRYYKHHLVPFGEFFPLPGFVKSWLASIDSLFGDTPRGDEHQPLIDTGRVKIGLTICFEDAFAHEVAKALPAAGLLANVTNDAWFAGTSAPEQHLNISRMRALEAGRYLLRAANTGISAVIGPEGRVLERTEQFEVAMIETSVQPRAGATPYVRYGDMPWWIGGFVLTGAGLLWSRLRRRIVQ